jgi:S1-C subfamily serine protease
VADAPGEVFAGAETPVEVGYQQAIVRITCKNGDKASRGSGILVEPGIVITAWHVVDEGNDITVQFADGAKCKGVVMDKDLPFDVASLKVEEGHAIPIPVSDRIPDLGDKVTIAGFGSGEYREATGTVRGRWKPVGKYPHDKISVSAGARLGDSGGPMIHDGKVVGILSSSDGRHTWGSHTSRLRKLLCR